jgi:hypothetical protein
MQYLLGAQGGAEGREVLDICVELAHPRQPVRHEKHPPVPFRMVPFPTLPIPSPRDVGMVGAGPALPPASVAPSAAAALIAPAVVAVAAFAAFADKEEEGALEDPGREEGSRDRLSPPQERGGGSSSGKLTAFLGGDGPELG